MRGILDYTLSFGKPCVSGGRSEVGGGEGSPWIGQNWEKNKKTRETDRAGTKKKKKCKKYLERIETSSSKYQPLAKAAGQPVGHGASQVPPGLARYLNGGGSWRWERGGGREGRRHSQMMEKGSRKYAGGLRGGAHPPWATGWSSKERTRSGLWN